MRKRLISICIIGILVFRICGCAQTVEETSVAEAEIVAREYTEIESEEESDAANAETTVVKEEHEKEEESGKEAEETLAYYFECAWADSGWNKSNEDRRGMGIIQITIPDDKKREKRINRMLVEESMKKLPGKQEQEWWDMVKLHIDYRSDRYLCWHYIPRSSFSEDCEWENLYFTLDLEKEKLLEYPGEVPLGEIWTGQYLGELYKEMEENWEKTVEEQDAEQNEKGYSLHETRSECDGIVFPVVEVSGLEDETIQERINEHLQEGLKAFIKNVGWEDDTDQRQYLFDQTKTYISYKSDRLLCVVYSISIEGPWMDDDGIFDLAVVVNIQTGERVMLDNLIDMDGLIDWMILEYPRMYGIGIEYRYKGLIRTERENLKEMEDMGYAGSGAMQYYQNEWFTFYLYRGRLILLDRGSAFDYEIPLPEIYEYLKVDPWYD